MLLQNMIAAMNNIIFKDRFHERMMDLCMIQLKLPCHTTLVQEVPQAGLDLFQVQCVFPLGQDILTSK
jgi:hypothetical protein